MNQQQISRIQCKHCHQPIPANSKKCMYCGGSQGMNQSLIALIICLIVGPIIIIFLAIFVALITPLVASYTKISNERACCTDAGGIWSEGACTGNYNYADYGYCISESK